jgi:hypothetical protein
MADHDELQVILQNIRNLGYSKSYPKIAKSIEQLICGIAILGLPLPDSFGWGCDGYYIAWWSNTKPDELRVSLYYANFSGDCQKKEPEWRCVLNETSLVIDGWISHAPHTIATTNLIKKLERILRQRYVDQIKD